MTQSDSQNNTLLNPRKAKKCMGSLQLIGYELTPWFHWGKIFWQKG